MIVIKKNPGERAQVVDISNTLEALQDAVGGKFATVNIVARDAYIVFNEEGWKNYPFNSFIYGGVFYGTVLIIGTCGDEFCSLSETDARFFEWLL